MFGSLADDWRFEAVSFEGRTMKSWTTLCAMALAALVPTWALSGCAGNEPAVAGPGTDRREPGTGGEHAKRAEDEQGGAKDEEHANHVGHEGGGHEGHGHGGTHRSPHGRGGSHEKGAHSDRGPGAPRDQAVPGGIAVGDEVPDFAVRTLGGKTVHLSGLQKDAERTKTGVVVLSFWCATCHSCRDVEGLLAELAKEYAGRAAVYALDANADDTPQGVAAFLKKRGLTLPVVLDPTGHAADVFGVQRTTTTVVIDGAGVLRYCGRFRQKDGAPAADAMRAVLAGAEVAVKTTPHDG
jgi:peroxiredoxin